MAATRSRSKSRNPNVRPSATALAVRSLRKLSGLPLAWVAERTGISEGHLSLFENGLAQLSMSRQAVLVRVMRRALRDHARAVQTAIGKSVNDNQGFLFGEGTSLSSGEPSARHGEGQVAKRAPGPIHLREQNG